VPKTKGIARPPSLGTIGRRSLASNVHAFGETIDTAVGNFDIDRRRIQWRTAVCYVE
jgi:hypothetical protein